MTGDLPAENEEGDLMNLDFGTEDETTTKPTLTVSGTFIQFDLLPLKGGRTRTGMHVWYGRCLGYLAWRGTTNMHARAATVTASPSTRRGMA